MGVHVLQRGNNVAIGRTRAFVPVVSGKPASKLTMTTIVVLNSRPSLVRKGVFSDDHLAAEVGENGRLTALLKAANTNKTTLCRGSGVDRGTQDHVGRLPGAGLRGHHVGGHGSGRCNPMARGLRRRCSHPTTDIGCCTAHLTLLRWSTTVRKVSSTTRPTPTNWWSPRDRCHFSCYLPEALLMRQRPRRRRLCIPMRSCLPTPQRRVQSPVLAGPDGVPIIRYAAAANEGGPGPDPRDTAVHVHQRMLADSWIEAATAQRRLDPREGPADHQCRPGRGR